MAAMEETTRSKAASKILNLFSSDVDEDVIYLDKESYTEKLDIILKFSNLIKEFRLSYNDNQSRQFIENICQVYDVMNARHNLGNQALKELTNILIIKINEYELSDMCARIKNTL
jgi:flagellin-specific chaperone FliS